MAKTLILVALQREYQANDVIYTGIGKINAALATTQAILTHRPTQIINYGSVGKVNPLLHGLHEVKTVLQRDMLAMPLAARGIVPLSEEPSRYHSSGTITVGTGDSFVTERDEWLHAQNVDVVDMELFAIAKICTHFQIPWRSFKYITDDANEESQDTWEENMHKGAELFRQLKF